MSVIKIQSAFSLSRGFYSKYSRIGILVDENTHRFCLEPNKKKFPDHILIKILSGEIHKNIDTCQDIWRQLTEHNFDRHSLLIILGGGVLGDMGGFCAATYKRGIDFCIIPTTLLSQVDASVGGKLGVDFGPYKNHIGLFQQPVATLIAVDFLKTLHSRELRSGFAEIIKHCIISDKKMWQTIRKKSLSEQSWLKLVNHSVSFKSSVVKKDPRESGLRKILNFGHTMGHAVEGYYLNTRGSLFHGEAVAAGMIMEASIAKEKKFLTTEDLKNITEYIFRIFGKIEVPEVRKLLPVMRQDKKNKGNKILMALPKGIGKAVWDISVSEMEISGAIDYYRSYQT